MNAPVLTLREGNLVAAWLEHISTVFKDHEFEALSFPILESPICPSSDE